MKAYPAGIPRSTQWGHPELELGGNYHFLNIVESLGDRVETTRLNHELEQLVQQLLTLEDDVKARGVAESILNHLSIGFRFIPMKLEKWGLL